MKELIRKLVESFGPVGFEDEVRATVHFADEGVDTGPIIIQSVVPVYDEDTEESLSRRILNQEHRIYPKAIKLYAEGKLRVEGRKVRVQDHLQPYETPRHNPPVFDF